ncbi:nitroreductase family protein [Endomicrobium proavitum]|uniref:NADH dehydrogenase/NAD(P)H nitroreductase n=1 Tax=Endomicrobium proavitum TaxID=1408281 RepID=A0A0G3WJ90_9BACT|nr:nitroreductase family protein [Endomicrobium proavitum]AKL98398.1 NADH dehydrogenase/NAD(P)H nitroreductase [Endomicrobium proavitum]
MDILLERKSVRKYTDDPVKDEDLQYILRAAMSAPTACNRRPFEFIVVKDKETHKKIAQIHEAAQMILGAPAAVIVVGDADKVYENYLPQDCAAVTQNALLAATAKGYGSVWCGIYGNDKRMDAFKKLFNLPKNIKPFSLIVIGKSADNNPPKNGWQPEKIKYEKWQ